MHNLLKVSAKASETEDTLATVSCQGEIFQYFKLLPGNPRTIIVPHYFGRSKTEFFSIKAGTSGNSKSLLRGEE